MSHIRIGYIVCTNNPANISTPTLVRPFWPDTLALVPKHLPFHFKLLNIFQSLANN